MAVLPSTSPVLLVMEEGAVWGSPVRPAPALLPFTEAIPKAAGAGVMSVAGTHGVGRQTGNTGKERPRHTRPTWENWGTGPRAPGRGETPPCPSRVHAPPSVHGVRVSLKVSTWARAGIGWARRACPQQLGLPVLCSPEGVPLSWVSSQVEDEGQLRVLLLRVGGDP